MPQGFFGVIRLMGISYPSTSESQLEMRKIFILTPFE